MYPRKEKRRPDNEVLYKQQMLLAITDKIDAMMSERSYQDSLPKEEVREKLMRQFHEEPAFPFDQTKRIIDFLINKRQNI